MKKADYLIISGLILSLGLFLYFSVQNVGNQTTLVLQNQKLIQDALDTSIMNNELILDNQQIIINLSSDQNEIIDRINEMQEQLNNHVVQFASRNNSSSP